MRVLISLLLSFLLLTSHSQAQSVFNPQFSPVKKRYLAEIRLHTPMEIENLLERASSLVESAEDFRGFEPIAVVLHGSEADAFRSGNYQRYRKLIDLAARLDAFNVIDVKICETWMRMNNVSRAELPAFVDTVPFGPAESRILRRQGYEAF
ncbi:MAG: hypothetical protein OIF57_07355 [Marinobacterium sp.]|nr:hypothetical protein [Marinobacterium sp.]